MHTTAAEVHGRQTNQELVAIFYMIETWLTEHGAAPGTIRLNTFRFNRVFDEKKSLCSLQYHPDYLQFKWFKRCIRALGKSVEFEQALARAHARIPGPDHAKNETATEYRLNILPEDHADVSQALDELEVIFK